MKTTALEPPLMEPKEFQELLLTAPSEGLRKKILERIKEERLNPRLNPPHGNRKHGHRCRDKSSPTYKSWDSMIERTSNENAISYPRYGAIGVKVCKRWLTFKGFYLDMGVRPPNTSLGRLLDMGDYKKGNAFWMTLAEQGLEKRKHNALIKAQALKEPPPMLLPNLNLTESQVTVEC